MVPVLQRGLGISATERSDECLSNHDIRHVSSVDSDRLRAASTGDDPT
jgi:hypothetical protein